MNKRNKYIVCIFFVMICLGLAACGKGKKEGQSGGKGSDQNRGPILNSPDDINLTFVDASALSDPDSLSQAAYDGSEKLYTFKYGDKEFTAIATEDNWKILNSYRITDHDDMVIICEALIAVMPVHGRDMVSYRTAEDMAYEWEQHNLAFLILPENNPWKNNARDVDLNPADQGLNLEEIYEARTGRKFDFGGLSGD